MTLHSIVLTLSKATNWIYYGLYAAVFHQQVFYYFGGAHGTQDSAVIAGLDSVSWKWSKLGNLKTARQAHSGILVKNSRISRFIVVGGVGEKAEW